MSHRWFTEVLGTGVCAQRDQECAVNPLFFDTALSLLCPQHTLFLQLTGFALSLGLAPIIVKQVFAKLDEVRKAGITVLVVEQNARLAMKFADYLYVLKYGRVVMEGAREEFQRSTALVDAYLGV